MTNEEYLRLINADPVESDVKTADDGSYRFLPISVIERMLDDIFDGQWAWNLEKEFWGKNYATGKGVVSFWHPVTGNMAYRSGTAAIAITKNIAMDYPRLEAAVIINAAKKIGKAFGRDLNRDKDDEAIPIIDIENNDEINAEQDIVMARLLEIDNKEDAIEYLSGSGFRLHKVLKAIAESKKSKL